MTSFSFIRRTLLAGGVALVGLVAIASPRPAVAAVQNALPSFACYETAFSPSRAPSVLLADEFGRRSSTVGAAVTLCTSASVNGKRRG